MIPDKKKTAEEIAALREGLGIRDTLPKADAAQQRSQESTALPAIPTSASPTEPEADLVPPPTTPAFHSIHTDQASSESTAEPIIHLNVTPIPTQVVRPLIPVAKPVHTLRKHELPLAPAFPVTQKTEIPLQRHDSRDMAEIRKRETLAKLQQSDLDPAAHLRRQTASPYLYGPAYLLILAAAYTAYQRFASITPAALLTLAIMLMIFIAVWKPRSRHHAALLFIGIFLTLAFGGLHYAPLFYHGP